LSGFEISVIDVQLNKIRLKLQKIALGVSFGLIGIQRHLLGCTEFWKTQAKPRFDAGVRGHGNAHAPNVVGIEREIGICWDHVRFRACGGTRNEKQIT
jgi:hypothetical protein